MAVSVGDKLWQTTVAGRRFGHDVRWHAEIGSTNDEAKRLAELGAAEGLLIVADAQTNGRGRSGRRWLTEPGAGLAASLLLRPELPALLAPRLVMLAGVAVCEAIEQAADVRAQLKWPNDVLVGGKKAGGILVESGLAGERLDYAVMGIGLNVAAAPGARQVDFPATSLQAEAGAAVERRDLLRAILERLEAHYPRLASGSREIHTLWQARLAWMGERVTAHTAAGDFVGLSERVDDEGALTLRQDDGQAVRVLAGDVKLRPAASGADAPQ